MNLGITYNIFLLDKLHRTLKKTTSFTHKDHEFQLTTYCSIVKLIFQRITLN